MASITKEITVKASVEEAWDAMRDVGALHTRLVPGFVINTELEPGARIVTFANGMTVRELIVSVDGATHRLVWSVRNDLLTHYNGAAQVTEGPDRRTRVVWTADLLPDSAAAVVDQMMEQGMSAMQAALNQPKKK